MHPNALDFDDILKRFADCVPLTGEYVGEPNNNLHYGDHDNHICIEADTATVRYLLYQLNYLVNFIEGKMEIMHEYDSLPGDAEIKGISLGFDKLRADMACLLHTFTLVHARLRDGGRKCIIDELVGDLKQLSPSLKLIERKTNIVTDLVECHDNLNLLKGTVNATRVRIALRKMIMRAKNVQTLHVVNGTFSARLTEVS